MILRKRSEMQANIESMILCRYNSKAGRTKIECSVCTGVRIIFTKAMKLLM